MSRNRDNEIVVRHKRTVTEYDCPPCPPCPPPEVRYIEKPYEKPCEPSKCSCSACSGGSPGYSDDASVCIGTFIIMTLIGLVFICIGFSEKGPEISKQAETCRSIGIGLIPLGAFLAWLFSRA